MPPGRTRRLRAVFLTLATTALLVALLAAFWSLYPWYLALHWGKQLESVPDDRVGALLDGIAQLGEPGIPVLVESLGSKRESVAGGARRAILGKMRGWEPLRARAYSPKLALLAQALADSVGHFPPDAQAHAADLAARILKWWALDPEVVDPAQVIAWCEKVVRTAARQRAPAAGPAEGGSGESRLAAAPVDWERPLPVAGPAKTTAPLGDLAKLPGGGIPIDLPGGSSQASDGSPSPQRPGAGALRPRWRDRRPSPNPLQPPRRLRIPPDVLTVIPEPVAPTDEGELAGLRLLRPLRSSTGGGSSAGDQAGAGYQGNRLAGVDTVELMRRLQEPDARTAWEAEAELARRGFTRFHLELARQMFHPDPKVRMELTRRLPELSGVNPVPWLLELSRDEDAEVRRSAISLMATTGDPALLRTIQTMARKDRDPRVQRQADRLAGRPKELR